MQTKKKQTKSKINWGWDAPEERQGKAFRHSKKQVNQIKRFGIKPFLVIFLVLVLCVGIGAGTCFIITKNDCFKLLGNEEQSLQVTEKYIEDGYNVVAFGENCKDDIRIETNMIINDDGSYSPQKDEDDQYIVGTYYIIYKCDNFKYSKLSKIQRIRLITFVESSDDVV